MTDLPFPEYSADNWANVLARLAELEQRVNDHCQRQEGVHGLDAGPTAERLQALELAVMQLVRLRNPLRLTDAQCERIAAAVLRVYESGVPEDDDGRSFFYPAIRDAVGAVRPPTCRVCGCTDDDCRQCVEKTGKPCSWVAEDLCSACF